MQIVAAHKGVTAQERRPDILVKFTTPYSERRVLIEVKETEDPTYMRDSVYKVLAYLRDFASLWEGLAHQKPKAILVFPFGIKPDGPISDVALVSADRTADIVFALDSAINHLVAGFPDGCMPAIA